VAITSGSTASVHAIAYLSHGEIKQDLLAAAWYGTGTHIAVPARGGGGVSDGGDRKGAGCSQSFNDLARALLDDGGATEYLTA
jgi:hypothetical protein